MRKIENCPLLKYNIFNPHKGTCSCFIHDDINWHEKYCINENYKNARVIYGQKRFFI